MYLLDTNACIRVLNGTSAALVARIRSHAPSELRVSSVTRAELLYGARRSVRVAENLGLRNTTVHCGRRWRPRAGPSGPTTCSSRPPPSRTT
jgi:predicted nucleic acid-binding protein